MCLIRKRKRRSRRLKVDPSSLELFKLARANGDPEKKLSKAHSRVLALQPNYMCSPSYIVYKT